ncbi:MAG: hypothetical protein EXR99_02190 [Gemmataceae bacterium]|nr:hypothetical protein [Gemmataceae bacterium]
MEPESNQKRKLKNGIRDATIVAWFWAISLFWSIGYCWQYGYLIRKDPQGQVVLETILGMPSWAFWGIFSPWVLCAIFTALYGLCLMRDDPPEPDQ